MTSQHAVLALMGPRARDILAPVAEEDVSNAAFPFGRVRRLSVAGAPVIALRITYVGELGWELHVPVEFAATVYDALTAAGAALGLRDAGYRAIESLRLEKGYRAWGAEIGPDHSPLMAGLGFAVKLRGNLPFLGRDALEAAAGAAAAAAARRLRRRRPRGGAARPRDDLPRRPPGRLALERRLGLHPRAAASATATSATPRTASTPADVLSGDLRARGRHRAGPGRGVPQGRLRPRRDADQELTLRTARSPARGRRR